MLRRLAPAIVFGVLCAAAATVGAEGVMFAHRFEKGTSNRYRVRFNGEADMRGVTMSQLGDMEVTVKCLAVNEGKYTMEMKFDKAELSRSVFGKLEADPRGEQLAGQAITFVVNDRGAASDIKAEGYSEVWNELRSALEPIVKDWYVYLPGEALPVGGEWKLENARETQAGGIEVTRNSRFKFKEMKKEGGRDCAVVTGTIESTFGGKTTSPAGDLSVSGGGTGKYEFLFDPAAGIVVRYKGKMDVEMDMVPINREGEPMQSTVGYEFEKVLL